MLGVRVGSYGRRPPATDALSDRPTWSYIQVPFDELSPMPRGRPQKLKSASALHSRPFNKHQAVVGERFRPVGVPSILNSCEHHVSRHSSRHFQALDV